MMILLILLSSVAITVVTPSTRISRQKTVCPPLISETLLIACDFASEQVNCSQPQDIGTTADLHCKPGYLKPSDVLHSRATCKRDGKWDQPLFSCNADCGGRHTNSGDTLISGGIKSKVGEFPWHVGVYELRGRILTQVCGGSLISTNIVISAAHCFWDEVNGKKKNETKFKLAAGKHKRIWEAVDKGVQKRDVLDIIVPALYSGRPTNYESDIAVVHVATPFEVTPSVNLICIDWQNKLEDKHLRATNNGLVTGWGYTEGGRQSDALMYVQLPYVNTEACLNVLPPSQQQLLTSDKFCAGYSNKSTSVCGGDSGGGLVFRHTDTGRYYLRGIVSFAFTTAQDMARCYSQLYTGFIRFSSYAAWVQDNV